MKVCVPLFPILLTSALAQDAVFPVGGVVIDAVNGNTLKRVRVAIAPSDSVQSEIAAMFTEDDGRFHFTLHKGKYRLTAQRRGLPPQNFGSDAFGSGFGVAVVVDSDQRTDNLVFRIFPPAAVSGKVVDDAGEPVEDALVQLLGSLVVGGRKEVRPRGYFYTDDLGRFRFGLLPTGTYYLAVTGKPWYVAELIARAMAPASSLNGSGERQMAYAPVYYPSSSDPRGAAPIVLKPGEEFVANLKLYAVPGVNVSIRCEGADRPPKTPEDLSKMRLELITEGIQGVRTFSRVDDFYGETTIPAVTPGHYTIRIGGEDQKKPSGGTQALDVGGSDVQVTVILKPAATVTGTVQLDSKDASLMGRLLVTLRDEATNTSYSRPVSSDGRFRVPLLPGKYRIFLTGAPGVFAKGVLDADTVKETLVEISDEAERSLRIIGSNGVGRVNGFVYRAKQPVVGAVVAMIPESQTSDPIYYRGFMTDSDGSFDFQNLPPGAYRIFAVDDPELEYANPVAMRMYSHAGKGVRVEAGALCTEDIEIP